MHVQSLKLTNVRAIDTAELRFGPGFNLVVGVNGVGKTTVLDALSWTLSFIVREVNGLKTATHEPLKSDIRFGTSGLSVECDVSFDGVSHTFLLHEPADDAAVAHHGEGKPREQTHDVAQRREFLGQRPARVAKSPAEGRPLAVLFSTQRAVAAQSSAKQRRTAGGLKAAFAGALDDRELSLSTFADWMRAQMALSEERPASARVLEAFEAATRRFLPGYTNLRVVSSTSSEHSLFIDRGKVEVIAVNLLGDADRASVQHAIRRAEDWLALGWTGEHLGDTASSEELDADRRRNRATQIEKELASLIPTCRNLQPDTNGQPDALIERLPTTIPVTQLSDGERGTLAMVLDLTRRLAQANPHLADPAAEAEAVVLIDEIDLHLHPRWQREIIHSLTSTFPKCQFIATTHSPQVISEVVHDRVQIMHADGVYTPGHSYGIDSSRILEELMGVSPHPKVIQEKLKEISELSRPDTLAEARAALDELAAMLELGESDPEVTRLQTLLDFLEDT